MYSFGEQVEKLAPLTRGRVPVVLYTGDVAYIPLPNGEQVVCAVDGYDVWDAKGSPARTDLTYDEAVAYVDAALVPAPTYQQFLNERLSALGFSV